MMPLITSEYYVVFLDEKRVLKFIFVADVSTINLFLASKTLHAPVVDLAATTPCAAVA
jgi:hypothetical protein